MWALWSLLSSLHIPRSIIVQSGWAIIRSFIRCALIVNGMLGLASFHGFWTTTQSQSIWLWIITGTSVVITLWVMVRLLIIWGCCCWSGFTWIGVMTCAALIWLSNLSRWCSLLIVIIVSSGLILLTWFSLRINNLIVINSSLGWKYSPCFKLYMFLNTCAIIWVIVVIIAMIIWLRTWSFLMLLQRFHVFLVFLVWEWYLIWALCLITSWKSSLLILFVLFLTDQILFNTLYLGWWSSCNSLVLLLHEGLSNSILWTSQVSLVIIAIWPLINL